MLSNMCVWPSAHKPTTERMRLKPAVPLKTEVPIMGLHSKKNFVTANAIETILAKPKQLPEDFRCAIVSSDPAFILMTSTTVVSF